MKNKLTAKNFENEGNKREAVLKNLNDEISGLKVEGKL